MYGGFGPRIVGRWYRMVPSCFKTLSLQLSDTKFVQWRLEYQTNTKQLADKLASVELATSNGR